MKEYKGDTKKYEELWRNMKEKELEITLSSILQTFNLKMEKYEGKYEET